MPIDLLYINTSKKSSAHLHIRIFAHLKYLCRHMNYIDLIGYLAAFGTTLSFLPQAIKTIQTKNTSGISLYMYALFTGGTLLWLIYGVLSGALPVAICNAVTFVFASIILAYKIKYK
ncbi:hypothetical protein GCM10027049_07850 [Mucilaginibacter puniceus]